MKEGSFSALALIAALAWQAAATPAVLAQNAWNQGLPPYSPMPSTPGLASGATAGSLSDPAQASSAATPHVAGFGGLRSRSGMSAANLPTSAADPRMQNMLGLVPKFTPDFIQKMQASNLPAGTVLTGILENDISSNKSKPGDVFSIRLEDGYANNGVEIIPKQSKILGSVTATLSSHSRHAAHPGTVSISLQTLVFPDGRTAQFWGFIEHNPLHDNVTQSGSSIKNKANGYGTAAAVGTMNFFTRRVGYNMARPNFGKEMELKKGEVLPIKTNRPLDLSKMNAPIQQTAMPPGAVNGMYQSGAMPPGMNAIPPSMSSNFVPGLPPYTPVPTNYAAAGGVPGLPAMSAPPAVGLSAPPAMALPAYTPPAGSGQLPMAPYPSQMEPF